MLNEQTMEKLYDLKLTGMVAAFKEQLQQPNMNELSFEERLALIVDRQWICREDSRLKRLLNNAKLKMNACIEDIDYKTPRGIDKSVVLRLSDCQWVKNHQNVIITGPTGVGKTYLSCALANKGCRQGYSSIYKRTPRLFQELAIARGDGSYPKLMNKLSKIQLMIIDDLGLTPLNDSERCELLEIVEDRHGASSTIVVSQIPVQQWHDNIGDPTIADAIMDRLIHNAHKFELKGESMRKKMTEKRKQVA